MTGRPAVKVVDGKKPCSRCNKILPTYEFRSDWNAKCGFTSACKECESGAKVGNQTAGRQSAKNSVLWTKYGIREEEYNKMYEDQEGRCLICKVLKDVLCVDHNHDTKKVRGLLCRECNFGLGKFADDPNRLLAAAAYLMTE